MLHHTEYFFAVEKRTAIDFADTATPYLPFAFPHIKCTTLDSEVLACFLDAVLAHVGDYRYECVDWHDVEILYGY